MSARHEGVSCDSCLKSDFRGNRYKCLICYDYDLCSICFEAGATTTRHVADHPMQCIIARGDYELYFGGETMGNEQFQSITCPYCGKLGYTKNTLIDHLTSDHTEVRTEVVCPICALLSEPNLITDDLLGHIRSEHRHNSTRDLYFLLDEPSTRRGRRVPPPSSRQPHALGSRARRLNFGDNVDPITELLSQLSGPRRSQDALSLHHVQLPFQLVRQQQQQQGGPVRQPFERIPRRAVSVQHASSAPVVIASGNSSSNTCFQPSALTKPKFILQSYTDQKLPEQSKEKLDQIKADRCIFVHELIYGALSKDDSDPDSILGKLE